MLYRPALHGNWNAFSLARRALKDIFPPPTVPLTTVLQNRQVFLPDPVYPTRCNFTQFIYIWKRLYMFQVVPPPIVRSAVDTVVCAPDRWRYHRKHVEQFPDINKLCKAASCWIYIGIYLRSTDP
jgi:hypothetical protein